MGAEQKEAPKFAWLLFFAFDGTLLGVVERETEGRLAILRVPYFRTHSLLGYECKPKLKRTGMPHRGAGCNSPECFATSPAGGWFSVSFLVWAMLSGWKMWGTLWNAHRLE